MIVHIPHDGRWVPHGLGRFTGQVTPLHDFGARQVFEGGHGSCLVFPVDRLVCDVERFKDGEPMESVGMGICYERNADLGHLRNVSGDMRDEIIRRFYDPHHARLTEMVDEEIRQWGRCLIIDGHTFSAVPRRYEASSIRPQIDIGHDGDESSVRVARLMVRHLREWYDVMMNEPFAGSLRPLSRIGDMRVASVMVEIRQDLDMELARKRVQGAMALVESEFYDGTGYQRGRMESDKSHFPSDAMTEAPFSSAERHRRIDALAGKYAYVDGFADLVYAHWDDMGLGSRELTRIEEEATHMAPSQ